MDLDRDLPSPFHDIARLVFFRVRSGRLPKTTLASKPAQVSNKPTSAVWNKRVKTVRSTSLTRNLLSMAFLQLGNLTESTEPTITSQGL
jgi:hypothetical protein